MIFKYIINIKKYFLANPHLWILTFVYLITAKGHIEIVDTEYSIRTALSIIENGSFLIEPPDSLNEPAVRYLRSLSDTPITPETQGKIYSAYGIGLSLIFIPFVLASKILSYFTGIDLRLILNFTLSFYNIPFAILGLYFFQNITLQLGASKVKSIFMTICLGIGTCYWKYTVTDFSEISQSCILLGIIHTILKRDKNMWYKVSLGYSCLILLKLTYVIFLPLLLIFFINRNLYQFRKSCLTNFFKSCSFFIPTCIAISFLNFTKFGNIFETGYGNTIKFSTSYFIRDCLDYLFSFDRGILTFNPILIFSFMGIFCAPIQYRKSLWIVGIISFVWYLTMCFWVSWQGGFCWGNRLLVPIIPLLLLPMVFLKFDSILSKILFPLTLLGSIIIQFAGSFTKVHEIILIKIKIQELTDQFPHSQLLRGLELFYHKLRSPNAEYIISEFGTKSTEMINLTSYNTFHGFNLWIVHFLNHAGFKNYSFGVGILVLVFVIFFCVKPFYSLINKKLNENCPRD